MVKYKPHFIVATINTDDKSDYTITKSDDAKKLTIKSNPEINVKSENALFETLGMCDFSENDL